MAENYQSIYEGERMDELWTLAGTAIQKAKVNGQTISPVAGVLTLPDYPSQVTWDNIQGKPTWIGSTKPSYTLAELTGDSTHRVVTDAQISAWNAIGSAVKTSDIKTLTIQKNGTTVDTYNPLTAKTINITDVASAQTLAALKTWIESMFEKDTTSVSGQTLIKAKFSLYSEGEITAGGVGSGGSGGGGLASVYFNGVRADDGEIAKFGIKINGSWAPVLTDSEKGEYVDISTAAGSVTSVGLSVPTGFSVTGSPITSSGTLAIGFASGYSLPTTAKQTSWDNKQNAISDLADIRSNAANGQTAYGYFSNGKLPYTSVSGTPTALKNPYSLTFGSKTYDGSSAKTITAPDLGALTSHQTVTLASGTNNGTLKLTTNAGTFDNIAVKGLGSAAYTASTAYATATQGSHADTAYNSLGNYLPKVSSVTNYLEWTDSDWGFSEWTPYSQGTPEPYGTSLNFRDTTTWYYRLMFGTSGRIYHYSGFNTTTIANRGTLAYLSDIPTNNNQLANGAGYITSSGSCAYASNAGNADTLDGQHAWYFQPLATAINTSNIGSQKVLNYGGWNITNWYPSVSSGWWRIAEIPFINYQYGTAYITIGRVYNNHRGEQYEWCITGCTYYDAFTITQLAGAHNGNYDHILTKIRVNYTWDGTAYIEVYIKDGSNPFNIAVNGFAKFITPELITTADSTVEADTVVGFGINRPMYINGNTVYHSGNANNTSTPWTCSNLTASGNVLASGDVTAGSDARWKHNITPVLGGIDAIMKLQPSEWEWNSDNHKGSGLIAQDVQSVLPHLVKIDNEGYLHLTYDGLHAYEISAIQSHETRIQQLERENAELKRQLQLKS